MFTTQPPKSVLAQVHLHPKVPIHTISFNCRDSDANSFLCQLAEDTGARFHYYQENGADLDGPEPWEVRGFTNHIICQCGRMSMIFNCDKVCLVQFVQFETDASFKMLELL